MVTSKCIQTVAVAVGLMCLALVGCKGETVKKPISGTVTCGGEAVAMGQVVFVPLDNTSQPLVAAGIADGRYELNAGGGVPLGKYRVRVEAKKKTGRKVRGNNGFEITMVDEVVGVGPGAYFGDRSPLTVNIAADFNGKFDIAIPVR